MAQIRINEISQNYTFNIGNNTFATVALPITASWGPCVQDPKTLGNNISEDDIFDNMYWSRFPANQQGLESFVSTYRGPATISKTLNDYSYQQAMTLLTSGYDVLVCRLCPGTNAQTSVEAKNGATVIGSLGIKAKYPGSFGNNIRLSLKPINYGSDVYYNAIISIVDSLGNYTQVENLTFVFDVSASSDNVLFVDDIESNFITFDADAFINAVSPYITSQHPTIDSVLDSWKFTFDNITLTDGDDVGATYDSIIDFINAYNSETGEYPASDIKDLIVARYGDDAIDDQGNFKSGTYGKVVEDRVGTKVWNNNVTPAGGKPAQSSFVVPSMPDTTAVQLNFPNKIWVNIYAVESLRVKSEMPNIEVGDWYIQVESGESETDKVPTSVSRITSTTSTAYVGESVTFGSEDVPQSDVLYTQLVATAEAAKDGVTYSYTQRAYNNSADYRAYEVSEIFNLIATASPIENDWLYVNNANGSYDVYKFTSYTAINSTSIGTIAYGSGAINVSAFNTESYRQWIYTYAYKAYNLLEDRLAYNPQRIISPGWDDQNIADYLDEDGVATYNWVVSPLSKKILEISNRSRCAAGLIDIPKAISKQNVKEYALKFSDINQLVPLYTTHSALICPWGHYQYVSTSRQNIASPAFLFLLLQRAMLLNQATQYEWALPTNRKTNLRIGKLDWDIGKKYLDEWQKLDGVGINCITNIPDMGLTIWGNSTLFNVPPATYQALANLSTRYLVNALEDLAYRCGIGITFQYNNAQAYDSFYAGMTPLLDTMKNVGAIDDYYVTMAADINGLDQVNANTVIGTVYIVVNGVINDINIDLIALPPQTDLSQFGA